MTSPAPGPGAQGHIFQGLLDGAHQIGQSWQPVNGNGEPAFQEMRLMIRQLPDVLVAVAGMCQSMANTCSDQIGMHSGTNEVLHTIHRLLSGPVPALQDAARAMDRPHDDDIRTMQTPDPRLAALDWRANQGYPDMP
jgi:hypothetical protein